MPLHVTTGPFSEAIMQYGPLEGTWTYWNANGPLHGSTVPGVWTAFQVSSCQPGHTNSHQMYLGLTMPNAWQPMPIPNMYHARRLFKTSFLHLQELENISEALGCYRNGPTSDIHIIGSWQDIKIQQWQIHALCNEHGNMCQVHHLSTEKEGENIQIAP